MRFQLCFQCRFCQLFYERGKHPVFAINPGTLFTSSRAVSKSNFSFMGHSFRI
jgi:hypothetical protein